MASLLQLSEHAYLVIMLKLSLNSLLPSSSRPRQQDYRTLPRSSPPKASLQHSSSSSSSSLSRREFLLQTAAISVYLLATPPARSEYALSDWERGYLPIDPNVVLLDIAFVPNDLNHGHKC
jgi:hypothetical protein